MTEAQQVPQAEVPQVTELDDAALAQVAGGPPIVNRPPAGE